MVSQQQKKPVPTIINDNILESVRTIGMGVGQTISQEVIGKTTENIFASLLGAPVKTGELQPNQSIEFGKKEAPQQTSPIPEIINPAIIRQDEQAIAQQMESVRQELKALSASIRSLNIEIKKAINETPVHPGIYHINFYEKLRSVLQVLREHINDSSAWLNMSNSRKKKIGFWGKYKKHGTQFGLSSERSVATSSG